VNGLCLGPRNHGAAVVCCRRAWAGTSTGSPVFSRRARHDGANHAPRTSVAEGDVRGSGAGGAVCIARRSGPAA